MKILVVGALQSSNLGDPLICHCVANQLQEAFPQAEITLADYQGLREAEIERTTLSNLTYPDYQRLLMRYRKQSLKRLKHRLFQSDQDYARQAGFLEVAKGKLTELYSDNWDAVVLAGGQLLLDFFGLWVAEMINRCAERQIPVFINACGTGEDERPRLLEVLQTVLRRENVCYISVRDGYEKVSRWNTGKTIHDLYDPALSTSIWYPDTAGKINIANTSETVITPNTTGASTESDKTDAYIGLGLIYSQYISPKKELRLWNAVIRELNERKLSWKLFCNGSPEDMVMARQLLSELGISDEANYIVPRAANVEEFTAQIREMRGLISYRLHSHITAASYGIPSVAIVWDHKLETFFGKLGYPERCLTLQNTAVEIVDRYLQAEAEGISRDTVQKQMEATRNSLIREIHKVVEEKNIISDSGA